MKYAAPISDIMTKKVKTISVTKSLYDAKSIMLRNKIRHLPVVKNGKMVGILSLTDIMRLSFGQVYVGQDDTDQAMMDMLTIEQVMKDQLKTVTTSTPIEEVAKIFTSEEYHALPVMENDELAGIITTTDLIKFFISQ